MQDPQDRHEPTSPIGAVVTTDDARWAKDDPTYRAQRDARAPYREIAWMLVKYRMDHRLTQQQLAERVGTSYSRISRIENGRQKTSLVTLQRIAHALDLKLVIGFEGTSHEGKPKLRTVSM
jgi:DNA-binding XRE family transcriptional regulator